MNKGNICFESERLIIREITISDSRYIVKWRSNKQNTQFFLDSSPLTLNQHLKWFESYKNNETRIDFVVIDKASELVIGTLGVQKLNRDCKSCYIAYMIGEEWARGKGYAIEGIKALCYFANDQLDIELFYAEIHKENKASRLLIDKLGFKQVIDMDHISNDFLVYYKKVEK